MWHRTGVVYDPGGYTQMPVVLDKGEVLRVYYSARDEGNRSYGAFVDLDAETLKVVEEHREPVIQPGPPGSFDDAGAMPSCIVDLGRVIYLYYVGWNRCIDVPYRQAIGIAQSLDGGETFSKTKGPVLDRSWVDPISVTMPFVLVDNTRWRMWYCSYRPWEDGEARYEIKYAEATEPFSWTRRDTRCMAEGWASGRPCVIKDGSDYLMWFCHRDKGDFRTNPDTAYRIGYALSSNGLSWNVISLDEFEGQPCDDWESIMQCYPYVYEKAGKTHMLYNGNGFGQTGIGHAVWED